MAVGLPPSASHVFALLVAPAPLKPTSGLNGPPAELPFPDADFAFGLIKEGNAFVKDSPACESTTRSCGRFGPASDGSTVARSSDRSSEYSASGVLSS